MALIKPFRRRGKKISAAARSLELEQISAFIAVHGVKKLEAALTPAPQEVMREEDQDRQRIGPSCYIRSHHRSRP